MSVKVLSPRSGGSEQGASNLKCAEGKVWIVSAGPGDPELLTLKAHRILNQVDVILYDNLVSTEIRALFPEGIPAIYVGKKKDLHSIPQDELNRLLVAQARRGLKVCRLKGGDAFVFGRGGEEMLELCDAGIPVEVVPGVTAAAGCSAYAGIPLTHRGLSQGVTMVTAHAEKELSVNWSALANLGHTLVFYMGISKAHLISTQLAAAGMDVMTPFALIEKGCCREQRVITGSLMELPALVDRYDVQSPALIVVGEVVTLAEQLQWFGDNGQVNSDLDNQIQSARKLSA